MKTHPYLKLKISIIEEYAMVIKKKEINLWKERGWLEYSEIGLSEEVKEAWMMYGEIHKDDTLIFNRPLLLKEYGVKKLIGRKITGFSANLGTYGMGGPGFFGLLLDNSEFLTYAVWGAGQYMLLEQRVVTCHPEFYDKVKPWVSNFGPDKTWDELTSKIKESIITKASLKEDELILILENKNKTFEMCFVKNSLLRRKVGRKENAFKKGEIVDYLLFQHKNGILVT